jgi:structural maintenance of chromosome 2
MKPQEILGLIEEAAGTSMFEDKKGKAIKTMERKQKKMEEIQQARPSVCSCVRHFNDRCAQLLSEEITPKLDRLRDEKRTYIEFQKASSELEVMTRLVVAYDWVQSKARYAAILRTAQAWCFR